MPVAREGRIAISESAQAEVARAAGLLNAWIHRKRRNIRDVEQALGWTHKTLWNALNAKTPLRISQIAAVGEVVGFDLSEFYRELADQRDREERRPPPSRRKPADEQSDLPLSQEERDGMLREILERLRDGGKEPGVKTVTKR